jgi:hypothetical protein
MPLRKPAGASARPAARKCAPRKKSAAPRKPASIKAAPLAIRQPPPPREADPFAKKTGARRSYYTAEFLAEAKRRIENTLKSTTAIAGDLGIDRSVLWRLVRLYGWVRPARSLRLRSLSPVARLAMQVEALTDSAHSRESGNPEPSTQQELGPRLSLPPTPIGGGDERTEKPSAADNTTIDRFEAAVLKELSVVETMRASLRSEPLRPTDAEHTARTLSSLTETLSKLRRLRLAAQPHAGSPHDDDIPDIDEFRRDLARRIEAFVASQPDDECVDGNRDVAVEAPQP